jgi:hypothetical protein
MTSDGSGAPLPDPWTILNPHLFFPEKGYEYYRLAQDTMFPGETAMFRKGQVFKVYKDRNYAQATPFDVATGKEGPSSFLFLNDYMGNYNLVPINQPSG